MGEEGDGVVVFDEFAEVKEGGEVGDAFGLLHVVSDDYDGELLFELGHEFLDFEGGDGVEGCAGFVHEEDLRAIGDGAGDAEALLLTAGEAEGAFMKFVFNLVPEGGLAEGLLDDLVELGFVVATGDTKGEDDVLVDGFGEGVVFLEDHTDAFAEGDDFEYWVKQAGAVEADITGVADAIDEIVHAVEVAEQGGFAATGGADESGDVAFREGEMNIVQHLIAAVPEIEVIDLDVRMGFALQMRGQGGHGLKSAGLVFAAEVGADLDGGEIEDNDECDEEEGSGEDHGFGRLGVGGLEAEIVNVKAEVHELAFGVDEGGGAIDGQGRSEFDDAGDHEGGDLARAACHSEDDASHDAGEGSREGDALDHLPFGCAAGEGGFADAAGDGGEGLFGGDDDDREGHEREGEGGPKDAAGAEGG